MGIEPSRDFPWHDTLDATIAFHCSLAIYHDQSPELKLPDRHGSLKLRKKVLEAKLRKRKK